MLLLMWSCGRMRRRRASKQEIANKSPDSNQWVKDCAKEFPEVATGGLHDCCSWPSCLFKRSCKVSCPLLQRDGYPEDALYMDRNT